MSFSFTADEFARIRHRARRVEDDAVSRERFADALLVAAERDVALARATAANPGDVTRACLDRFALEAQAQLRRSQDALANMQRLCTDAREHRRTTDRLIAELRRDTDDAGLPADDARRAVLVVDDFDDGRELVCAVLTGAGFIVRTASNGLEALLTAYEMRPAVIVMDVTMPVLDGIEATRLIKAVDSTRDTRVIACTGSPSALGRLADTLFVAVLSKPASPDAVLATVRQHAAA
jgi:two-component system, cell cycle response regulator DivK